MKYGYAKDIVVLPIFDGRPDILDFGCGDGKCLPVWKTKGRHVVGYDPSEDEFSQKPNFAFDVVVIKHVITVFDTIGTATAKIQEASDYLKIGGYLCIVIGDMIDFDMIMLIVETADNFELFDIEMEYRGELIVAKKRHHHGYRGEGK